jgi:anti-sigma factor RsiW
MTPTPDPADPPEPWPDVLAAYADGELDEVRRAAVERWLAAHPEARGCVRAQRELSPENWRLWRDAEPPCPGPCAWDAVQDGIAAALRRGAVAEPAVSRGGWRRRAGGGLVATVAGLSAFAASLALFGAWFLPPAPQRVVERSARVPYDDPLAGFAVLPIASDAEVDVRRVNDAGAGGWLPVGGMPLSGPLTLATADDVDVEGAEEHPAWQGGTPRVTRDPADAPVLFPDRNR